MLGGFALTKILRVHVVRDRPSGFHDDLVPTISNWNLEYYHKFERLNWFAPTLAPTLTIANA